ncbi:MAG: hypothetical protein HKP14_02515, partial [Bacteroidia bacterium]|nr:hypothetical protein [Bacteroidia bacterium]
YTHTYNFDDHGLISFSESYKKGEKTWSSLYTYNEAKQPYVTSSISMNKKGNIEKSEFYWHADSSRASEYVVTNSKGDTTFRSERSNIQDLKSIDNYYRKGKLKKYWVNEYYENKSLKKTILYSGKGKEKYIWDYQCKEEGIEIKKQKDTTTRCESVSKDKDGITTHVYHTVNEKGELFKTINKQNKAGKYFYFKRTKGPKDLLLFEQTTFYKEDDSTRIGLQYAGYRKGEKSYSYKYTYDSKGNEISRFYEKYKKGEMVKNAQTTYEYDSNNRPIKRLTSDSLSKEQYITEYTYDI